MTGEGPWHWTCSGLYGGEAATCEARPRVNAVCGSASTFGQRQAPSQGLCAVGSPSAVTGDGPWSWTCLGQDGGATVSCRADAAIDGVCGSANGNQYASTPNKGLCEKGRASQVSGNGPWNWRCLGENGGDSVSCTAALGTEETLKSAVACGAAAEVLAFARPESGLCAAGSASEVGGEGPWRWTCADEAGHSVSCSTLSAVEGACGAAANVASPDAPFAQLCQGGTPGEVSADRAKGFWNWTCKGEMGGGSVSCAAPIASRAAGESPSAFAPASPAEEPVAEASCGPSAGQGSVSAPEAGLCSAGTPGPVKGSGPWHWTCKAGKKGPEVRCEAPRLVDGACGASNGAILRSAPSSALCAAGTPTFVAGEGPWMWSCVGLAGGSSASCSALSQAQTKVDGLCGASSGASLTAPPEANLCESGSPSAVYGEGPWTWTCSGINGGVAATCRAGKTVPQAPPPPGPLVNGLCGPANGVAFLSAPKDGLCATGTATATSGDGPWNWSCIGMNGGMTVSCTAPLMPPAPIVGACGSASGVPAVGAPQGSLCAAGIPSAVSGNGPWTWSCSGTNGGGAVGCVAPVASGGVGTQTAPLPSFTSAPDRVMPSPKAAPVGLVTPTLPSAPKKDAKPSASPEVLPAPPSPRTPARTAPLKTPSLPDGVKPLTPPSVEIKPMPGMLPSVIDSQGKPVASGKIVLEPDVSTIAFSRGSDRLDEDAVEVAEKLAAILKAHEGARITLVAYASLDAGRSPREARQVSLRRALAVRDFLSGKGVPAARVDVRPMGANVTSGDMDRVDVRVN